MSASVTDDTLGPRGIPVRIAREVLEKRVPVDPTDFRNLHWIGSRRPVPSAYQHVIELVLHQTAVELGEIDEVGHAGKPAILDSELGA